MAGGERQGAAWPEGVIARYLTVGGATVDLTLRHTLHATPEPFETLATCTGCPASKQVSHYRALVPMFGGHPVEEHEREIADAQARDWAQAHAETCRALPKPGGEW